MSDLREDNHGVWPKSEEEFLAYVRGVLSFEHDSGSAGYEASADALWKVAVAAFNYAAHVVGATGFQASWAGLQFLKTTRGMEEPFAILDGAHLLYPQYDLEKQVADWLAEWRIAVAPKAKELLAERSEHAHPNVVARWRGLAALAPDEETQS